MNTKKHNKGLTLLEMMMAIGIIAAVFAALLPQFANINNSWASRQENLETLQVERIVTSHLRNRFTIAKSIIAVSDPDETNGFLEYKDIDGITYRYQISGGNLVFGPVGNMATLAESVTELQFSCYALDDLDNEITDVDQIRFIEAEMEIDEPSGGSETVAISVYLRTGVSEMSGIIGWWKLDEASGLVAADSSGYDNHGALGNMVGNEWTGGVLGGALEFDGSNDHIAGIGTCPTGNYTVTGWAKDTGPASGSNAMSVIYSADQEIWLGVDRGDSARLWLDVGGNGKGANTAAGAWTRNTWHHLAATWDGSDVHIYIDGLDMPISVYGIPENAESKAAVIGAWSKTPSDENWYGPLDDIRVYDYALNAAEIAQLANILRYREFTEAKAGSDTTSITISTPSGTNKNDLLIAAVATDDNTSVSLSPPGGGGWTRINTGNYVGRVSLGTWWKLADSSESPDHQFTWTGPEQAYGWMMRFTGHDPADPINTYTFSGTTSSTPTSPSVTTTVDNAIILRLGAFDEIDITIDDPGLAGHTAITMNASAGEVAYEEIADFKLSSAGSSLTIDTPVGVNENDLLIAAVATDWWTIGSLAPPSGEGWTLIDLGHHLNSVTLGIWWKLADASESPSHQFVWSGTLKAYGWIMCFTGHDQANPIHRSAANGGNSSSPTCPAVTTTIADCTILRIGAFDDDDVTVGSPGLSGHIAITMDESGSGSSTCSGGAGYVIQPSIGDSGTSDFTLTASEQYRTVTIAIAPAGGGSGGADSVSGGAGYFSQSLSGNSGTSTFSLTASEESRMITIGIAPDPANGGSLMP